MALTSNRTAATVLSVAATAAVATMVNRAVQDRGSARQWAAPAFDRAQWCKEQCEKHPENVGKACDCAGGGPLLWRRR
ncbi:hypothetical protein [Allostreptomyces psammosilenae]|uniref:Uncharacterized protein n=1 Tax=Allostreptomyces psammosilenae TaxID=1892865 RepID=A0A852ZTV5_9ACTN|nr:hypothetical protein [Allostreptomyces psammosilenae]NYI05295.1 hypothetical protein [Allostreptomyces psammosilenae]